MRKGLGPEAKKSSWRRHSSRGGVLIALGRFGGCGHGGGRPFGYDLCSLF